MSVRRSCDAAGFGGRTSFARASRLLERDDVRTLIRAELLRSAADAPRSDTPETDGGDVPLSPEAAPEATEPDGTPGRSLGNPSDDYPSGVTAAGASSSMTYDLIEERILREYERIAFADASCGDVKIADRLRALEQYRAIAQRRFSDEGGGVSLTVNYDYGDGCG